MTTQTRIQLALYHDTQTIHYKDADTLTIFHIEDHASLPPLADPSSAAAATVAVCQAFARQHVIRNGVPSAAATRAIFRPPPGDGGLLAALKAMVDVHVNKTVTNEAEGAALRAALEGMAVVHMDRSAEAAVRSLYRAIEPWASLLDGEKAAAVRSLYRVLGSLVSLLEQIQEVAEFLERERRKANGRMATMETVTEM